MPKLTPLDELIRRQDGVLSRVQALAHLSEAAVRDYKSPNPA